MSSQCQQSLSRHPTRTRPFRLHGYQCGNASVSRASSPWRGGIVVPSSHHEYFDICLTHKLWECNLETNYCKHGLPLGTKQLNRLLHSSVSLVFPDLKGHTFVSRITAATADNNTAKAAHRHDIHGKTHGNVR